MDTNNAPRTVNDLFPSKWLRAEDLQGREFTLAIRLVKVEKVHSKFTGQDEWKAAVWFQNAQKALVLNQTQAHAIAEIAGTDVLEKWHGVTVTLKPGRAHNGRETIIVLKPVKNGV